MFKLIVTLLTVLALTACGGGGSGSADVTPEQAPPEVVTPDPKPDPTDDTLRPIVIKDPIAHRPYSATVNPGCDNPVMQFVIPIDLNNDKYKDFIVHYWCRTQGYTDAETPDALVAHISNSEGEYHVGNLEVFGSETAQLGGASRKYRRADINGDGFDDFVFAMNREDGRDGSNSQDVATKQSAMMSQGQGKYEVQRLDADPIWGHAVAIVKNGESHEVIFSGYSNPSTQAFRYVAGEFVDISNEYKGTENWSNHVEPLNKNGVTEYIAAAGPSNAEEHRLDLFTKSGSDLTLVSSYDYNPEFHITVSGKGSAPFPVFTVGGQQIAEGALFSMCKVADIANNKSLLAVKVSGFGLKNGGSFEADGAYSNEDIAPKNLLSFFEYSEGNLRPVNSPITNEVINTNYNFFDCSDANGDNLADIVVSALGVSPIVYINDNQGNLTLRDTSELPGHSSGGDIQGNFVDVDSDGILDLIEYGTNATDSTGSIEIFLLDKML